jgi:AcrR family transcriptional regulator
MARPRLDPDARRAQIVKASMALFAKKGFSGTTSRELARAAGVSEALIFRLFPTKRALYDAIIQRTIAEAERPYDAPGDARLPDRDLFLRLATDLLGRVRRDDAFLRLLMYAGLEGHALSDLYYEAHVARLIAYLRRRIAAGTRAGRYRAADPVLAARAFMGMLVQYATAQALFARGRWPDLPVERVARTFVDLFFSGLERGGRP